MPAYSKKTVYILIFIGVLTVIGGFYIFNSKEPVDNRLYSSPVTSATMTPEATPSATAVVTGTASAEITTTMEGLKIEDQKVGTGALAIAGKRITVNYSGTLTDGTKFDSSYDRGTPFVFNLGAGEVIQGWDQGFAGMKVGGKRKLTIPPELGYGASGIGGVIPPNATLIFDVELLGVE